jgi:hypothetical protein
MVGIRTLLWTGDTKGAPKVLDTDYPAEYGYRDMRNARYGAYSHGTLGLQVQRVSSALQSFSLDIGADAERIRHAVQNRLIHDLVFLPKGWVRTENAHVPMLDAEGQPYLFHDAQRVAPPELFLDVSLNPPLFY